MEKLLKYLAYAAALAAAVWSNVPEVVKWLMLLMLIDTLAGTILAIRSGTLSSAKAWIGGTKKIGTLLIIGLVYILENGLQLFPGLPLVGAVTGYYIWTEALSIVTNAAALGVPIPDVLAQALASLSPNKLSASQDAIAPQSPIADSASSMSTSYPTGSPGSYASNEDPPQDPRTMRGA